MCVAALGHTKQSCSKKSNEYHLKSGTTSNNNIYIYIYIYTKIIVWCEDEERSIPLQVERKVKVNTRGKD